VVLVDTAWPAVTYHVKGTYVVESADGRFLNFLMKEQDSWLNPSWCLSFYIELEISAPRGAEGEIRSF
jgi:hypothetical protein